MQDLGPLQSAYTMNMMMLGYDIMFYYSLTLNANTIYVVHLFVYVMYVGSGQFKMH